MNCKEIEEEESMSSTGSPRDEGAGSVVFCVRWYGFFLFLHGLSDGSPDATLAAPFTAVCDGCPARLLEPLSRQFFPGLDFGDTSNRVLGVADCMQRRERERAGVLRSSIPCRVLFLSSRLFG